MSLAAIPIDSNTRISIKKALEDILQASALISIASAASAHTPHMTMVYYSYELSPFKLYFLTSKTSKHWTLTATPVAATVFDSTQRPGDAMAGLQLEGIVQAVRWEYQLAAFRSYGSRFSKDLLTKFDLSMGNGIAKKRILCFTPTYAKVFDMQRFGKPGFVELHEADFANTLA